MKQHLKICIMFSAVLGFAAVGCGDDTDEEGGFLGDGGDNISGTDGIAGSDSTPIGSSDPSQTVIGCEVGNIMENFDADALPAGWTIISGSGGSGSASGSGSGSGSGGGTLSDANDASTWHHTSVEEERFAPPDPVVQNMSGGFFKVGDSPGMNESLETDYYPIGNCSTVTVSFKQYFEDWADNDADRGEVGVLVDTPPWVAVKTINTTGYTEENIDITDYLTGGEYFKVRLNFSDDNQGNWPWFIDDFAITGVQ